MNADASQAALPLPWFVGLCAAAGLVVVVVLLVESWQAMRRADDQLDVYASDDDEPIPYTPVEPPHSCPECDLARVIARQRLRAWFAARARVEWTEQDDREFADYARNGGA
jgi:hypothetical protein